MYSHLQFTSGTSVARVAEAAYALHGIPGRAVVPSRLVRQHLLRKAGPAVVAVVRTDTPLTRQPIVSKRLWNNIHNVQSN